MIRVLIYLVVLAALAYGGLLVVENPGHVTLTWHGTTLSTTAALLLLAVAVAAIIAWRLLRLVLGLPGFVKVFARQRRREKGYAALSRGLIAVGSGDARAANRAAAQAGRALRNDPLAIMLRAQAAHLNGDEDEARAAFEVLAQRDDTRVLGLRGLHAAASRRGDDEAAHHFAAAAHRAAPLPWSAQAVLEHRAAAGEWEKALATVETSVAAKLLDKDTAERQRAVLETAIAYDKEMSDGRRGSSTQDRRERAKTLRGIAAFDPVSRLTVARAALAAKDFATARKAMAPLIAGGQRPSVRTCLLMAELEEAEHGDTGSWREWLARSSHAALDPAWIADGKVYDHWAPVSPTTGKLDAFRWRVPAERFGPVMDALPARTPPADVLAPRTAPMLPPEPPAASETPALAQASAPPERSDETTSDVQATVPALPAPADEEREARPTPGDPQPGAPTVIVEEVPRKQAANRQPATLTSG